MIVREAIAIGVDPAMGLAIAKAESNFNLRALSHAGARGVMQIMPATARGEFGVGADQLWDPALNVRLGLKFYKHLLHVYGREDIALSHYNGGSRVRTPTGLRVIPATRAYVDTVGRYRTAYAQRLNAAPSARNRVAAAPPPARTQRPSRARVAECRPVRKRGLVRGRPALLGGSMCRHGDRVYIRDRHVIAYL